jgi:outer membrane protein OmpA-like peptidoglycan-associated protein
MKKFLLSAVTLFSILSASAQYKEELSIANQFPGDERAEAMYRSAVEKQVNPRTTALRTAWMPNKPGSNWFFSLEGGFAYLGTEHYRKMKFSDNVKPTVGVSLGKWFSPVWGLRLNVTGAKLQGAGSYGSSWYVGTKNHETGYITGDTETSTDFIQRNIFKNEKTYRNTNLHLYGLTYIGGSVDFLLNLKNFFTPYNPNAIFNPVLYGGVGMTHTVGKKQLSSVNNLLVKGGLQLNLRLIDPLDVYLAAEAMVVPESFDRQLGGDLPVDAILNAKLGLTYRFNFRPFIKMPVIDQNQWDALNREINDLRNRPKVVCPPVPVCPEVVEQKKTEVVTKQLELTPVFFGKGSSQVQDNQLLSVAKAAMYLSDNPKAKLEIAAYSDKKTGKSDYNLQLSEKRAKAVLDILIQKFGIDKSRLKISSHGDTVQPFAENDKNRVSIFVR